MATPPDRITRGRTYEPPPGPRRVPGHGPARDAGRPAAARRRQRGRRPMVVRMSGSATARVPAGLRYDSGPGRWVLAATVLGSAIAAIDATVVGIALPAIGREFPSGLATLQWVVTAYTLTLAGLLLVAGALGDRYGRRKGFVIGVVWFAPASVRCGLAPSAGVLIAPPSLPGVGGALLTPGSLAVLAGAVVPA